MNQIRLQDYIENPCKSSSLPYWKTKSISVPADMLIVHDEQYKTGNFDEYDDERYFRLQHSMNALLKPELPYGYDIVYATASEYVVHINDCYSDLSVTGDLIRSYADHAVYDANLWVAVADAETKQIVASGIAEYDPEVSEGALEWIQVTEAYRGKGLGEFIVNELLWRMREKAAFVTVSGKVDNKTNPERLYRKCGFTGSDVWHILRRKRYSNMADAVIHHYDLLIEENNDPVHDPKPLQDYMNKWDGQAFIDSMEPGKDKSVLEVGVGTGRLAMRVAPLCGQFCGIDISPKTIDRAKENLSEQANVVLLCDDFLSYQFDRSFDVIYSSLTFMHIEDKQRAVNKIAELLNDAGRFVLSIDKNPSDFIDNGTRKIKIYPDTPDSMSGYIRTAGLTILEQYDTELATVFVAQKDR